MDWFDSGTNFEKIKNPSKIRIVISHLDEFTNKESVTNALCDLEREFKEVARYLKLFFDLWSPPVIIEHAYFSHEDELYLTIEDNLPEIRIAIFDNEEKLNRFKDYLTKESRDLLIFTAIIKNSTFKWMDPFMLDNGTVGTLSLKSIHIKNLILDYFTDNLIAKSFPFNINIAKFKSLGIDNKALFSQKVRFAAEHHSFSERKAYWKNDTDSLYTCFTAMFRGDNKVEQLASSVEIWMEFMTEKFGDHLLTPQEYIRAFNSMHPDPAGKLTVENQMNEQGETGKYFIYTKKRPSGTEERTRLLALFGRKQYRQSLMMKVDAITEEHKYHIERSYVGVVRVLCNG